MGKPLAPEISCVTWLHVLVCALLHTKVSSGQKPNQITAPCSPKGEPQKRSDNESK